MASLVAGAGSGLGILALELLGGGQTLPSALQVGVSGAVGARMAMRYAESGKFMPAGLTALLSGGAALMYAARVAGFIVVPAKTHSS